MTTPGCPILEDLEQQGRSAGHGRLVLAERLRSGTWSIRLLRCEFL
jgi:hypothetical protein